MSLLIFHLVLSSFTFEGVDIRMAQKILDYHIERYPNGAYAPPPPELPFTSYIAILLCALVRRSRSG